MLTSISPLGERARGNRFGRTAAAYLAGSLAGGTVAGGVLGAAGTPLVEAIGGWRVAVLVAVAVAGVGLDATGRLPTPHRQVDERWLSSYRGWVYGAGFGFQLGLGAVTIVTASATYVMLVAALLAGSPAAGAAIGATFGVGRALPLLATSRVRTTEDLARLHRAVAGAARRVAVATRIAQVTLVAAGAAVLLSLGGAA